MRRSLSVLVAGLLVLTGPAASLAPAQAAMAARIAPASTNAVTPADSIVAVKKDRRSFKRIRSRCSPYSSRCGGRRAYFGSRYSDGAHDGPHKYRREYDGPRYSYRDYDGPRYSYRRYDRPRYSSRYYHRRDNNAAVAAGIFGFAAGVILGSQLDGGSSHSACARRYRSYDHRTGTFLGYDGRRHACRLN